MLSGMSFHSNCDEYTVISPAPPRYPLTEFAAQRSPLPLQSSATHGRPWLAQLATWRMFSVYNSHSLERAALGSHKHSQPVDSGLLRARDALQHFRAEERDGVRLVGLHGV